MVEIAPKMWPVKELTEKIKYGTGNPLISRQPLKQ